MLCISSCSLSPLLLSHLFSCTCFTTNWSSSSYFPLHICSFPFEPLFSLTRCSAIWYSSPFTQPAWLPHSFHPWTVLSHTWLAAVLPLVPGHLLFPILFLCSNCLYQRWLGWILLLVYSAPQFFVAVSSLVINRSSWKRGQPAPCDQPALQRLSANLLNLGMNTVHKTRSRRRVKVALQHIFGIRIL